jgi:peptidoglycan/xylan/chitin deacetylase (PgdA/CDA1 family)
MARLSELLCRTVYALRIDSAVRATIARRRVSILMYHRPSPDGLERHLRYIVSHYNVISLDMLVDALRTRDWRAIPKRALVLTFDDGAREVAGLVGVLRRYGTPATMYVCSGITGTNRRFWFEAVPDPWQLMELPNERRLELLERCGFVPTDEAGERSALSLDELARVSDVADIASHTRFHPPLTTCTDEEAEFEIDASRGEIEALSGRSCLHFCYPHGYYGQREAELVRKAGYQSARTIDFGWNGPRSDAYRLRILGTVDDSAVARLAADLSGICFLFRWRETGRLDGRMYPERAASGRRVRLRHLGLDRRGPPAQRQRAGLLRFRVHERQLARQEEQVGRRDDERDPGEHRHAVRRA